MTIEPKQLIGTCNYGGIPEFVVMKTPLLSFYEDNFHSCRGGETHQWSSGRIAPCHGFDSRLVHVFLWPFCLLGHLSENTISTCLRKSPAFLIHKTLGLSPDPRHAYLVDVVQPSRQIASPTHFLILTSYRPWAFQSNSNEPPAYNNNNLLGQRTKGQTVIICFRSFQCVNTRWLTSERPINIHENGTWLRRGSCK